MLFKITVVASSVEEAITKIENLSNELDLTNMEPNEISYGPDLTIEALD